MGYSIHQARKALLALVPFLVFVSFSANTFAEVKLAPFPDYQQSDFAGSNDCSPTASADVLGYWDANGFPNIIEGSNDYSQNTAGVTALVDLLKHFMNWDASGTSISAIDIGIIFALRDRGYSFDALTSSYIAWSKITTEIDADRPGVFSMYHPFYGGMHSVGCFGYDEADGTRMAIVHDNWYPAGDVYLNFDECSTRFFTAVTPPDLPYKTVSIQSTPVSQVLVTVAPVDRNGSSGGLTNFTRQFNTGETVTVTAPPTRSEGGINYEFIRWRIAAVDQPLGQTSVSLAVNSDTTVVAVYAVAQHALTVQSTPEAGVSIFGDWGGSTNYTATCVDQEAVTLRAPVNATLVSKDYDFVRWTLDGADQPEGQAELSLTMTADHTAVAVYELAPPSTVTDLAASIVDNQSPDRLSISSVSTSGDLYNSYVGANVADGDADSFWSTPATNVSTPAFLILDMGQNAAVRKVRLLPRSGFANLFPTDFSVAISRDGSAWKVVAEESGYQANDEVWYEKVIPAEQARYVRLSMPESNQFSANRKYYLQIAEAELYSQSVALSWSAPGVGDSGSSGAAASYVVRYSTIPILDEAEWNAATDVTGEPAPEVADTPQVMLLPVDGLPVEQPVYFAIRSVNRDGTLSPISNTPSITTAGKSPAPVTDLAVTHAGADSLAIGFTAVGDDGTVGTAASYDVRYSTQPITDDTWDAATHADGTPTPAAAGSAEGFAIAGLAGDTAYYVALKVLDECGNASAISNVAQGTTTDIVPPAAIIDLMARVSPKAAVSSVAASTSLYGAYVPEKISDGDSTTFWSSAASGAPTAEFITLDLGRVQSISSIKLLPRTGFPELFPDEFVVERSTNGTSWQQILRERSYVAHDGQWYRRDFSSRPARYIRLSIPASRMYANGNYYIQIAEFELYQKEFLDLSWTAPGDNANNGRANSYQMRWSSDPITTEADWNAASVIDGLPAPAAAGATEHFLVEMRAVPAGATAYFAVRASDEAANTSENSDSAAADIPADNIPGPIRNLGVALMHIPPHAKAMASGYLLSYVASNAIDSDPASFWSSAASTEPRAEYLALDLGKARSVSRVRLLPRAGFAQLFPSKFSIEVSMDGTNWYPAVTENGYTAQEGAWYEATFSPHNAVELRISTPQSKRAGNGLYYVQIAEFQAYDEESVKLAGMNEDVLAGADPEPQQLELSWTAPDAGDGVVSSYEIRYATQPIETDEDWAAAEVVDGAPVPAAPGTAESMTATLDGKPTNASLYFAIRSRSEFGRESDLSNSPVIDTPIDVIAPEAITDLSAAPLEVPPTKLNAASVSATGSLYDAYTPSKATDGSASTFWSSEAASQSTAESLTLDLSSTQPISSVRLLPRAGFPQLFPSDFTIETSTDGQTWTQTITETGYAASDGQWYEKSFTPCNARYVRLSAQSMLYSANNRYYLQIAEFEVYSATQHLIQLTWTAPGDDNTTGTAASYEIRWSPTPIISTDIWTAATPIAAGIPAPQTAGTVQTMTVPQATFAGNATVYFAMRAIDDSGNKGVVGNTAGVGE